MTGFYRGPAHAQCNLQYSVDIKKIKIPVFFHGGTYIHTYIHIYS